jgi:hypothetical protein
MYIFRGCEKTTDNMGEATATPDAKPFLKFGYFIASPSGISALEASRGEQRSEARYGLAALRCNE